MQESDIARKCVGTLIGVAALVSVSVLVSWWGAGLEPAAEPATGRSKSSAAPASASPPASAPAVALAWRPESAPAPAAPADRDPDRVRWERRAFQLETENVRLRSRLEDMLNWILDNVRGTYPLPENQMAHLQVSPAGNDLAVSEDLVQLLRLDEEEIGRLDAAFLGTKSALQEIEAENISVENPADNQVVLNIPPFAEEGQAVREDLYGELEKTLGAARFNRLLQVGESGLAETFEYFGEADRTLWFEAVVDSGSGDSQLFVRDERVLPDKDDPLRHDIRASERIVTELPEEYYPYWDWLPDYVTRFARSN
ncbi:MAG: hypothetical protein AB7V14_03880 [Kiritimatiellia bacterium]